MMKTSHRYSVENDDIIIGIAGKVDILCYVDVVVNHLVELQCPVVNTDKGIIQMNGAEVDILFGMDYCNDFELVNYMNTNKVVKPDETRIMSAQYTSGEHKENQGVTNRTKDVTIRASDFEATRKNGKWIIAWKWINKPEEKQIRPAFYDGQIESLTTQQRDLFRKEINLWIEKRYIRPCTEEYAQATYTIMPQIQMHKESTPVRPVLNLKPLNIEIKSMPNEQSDPLACGNPLRRWRCKYGSETLLIDIKKAYLQVSVDKELQPYLCLRIPYLDHEYWAMDSMPFGLNIAPKCLTTIIQYCLKEDKIQDLVEFYVDDGAVEKQYYPIVKKCLEKNDFTLKEPEKLYRARVLGIQMRKDKLGYWARKGGTPQLQRVNENTVTRTQIGSWVGKLVAHYPIAKWLRSACAMLTRLASIDTDEKDQVVSKKIVAICDKLENDILVKGDPVEGQWKLNVKEQWTLYVDASRVAYGACLYVGQIRAEDGSWIRPRNDHRHINIAELDSVLKGLTLVMQYRKVNKIKGTQHINLKTDNKSVAAWLSRKKSSHWIPVKGICRSAVESRLQYYEDTLQYNDLEVDVQWIASYDNLADELSRVPQYMIGKDDNQVASASSQLFSTSMDDKENQVAVTVEQVKSPDPSNPDEPVDQRNWISRLQRKDGKVVVPEEDVIRFMTTVHDHEGASALYNRLRSWTNIPHLKKRCREAVSNCDACQRGKTFPGDRQAWHNTQGYAKCEVPFAKVYTDVVGPYQTKNSESSMFAITIVDGASGYALTRSTKHSPTSQDVVELFQHLTEVYGTSPLVVHTDNGSIFVSERFSKYLRTILAVQERSAVHASWSNGKVERLHRDINAYIRCRSNKHTLNYKEFSLLIKKATTKHNVTPQRDGKCPHDKIFRFNAVSEPYMPIEFREGYDELFSDVVDPSQLTETLKKGTKVLCRKHVLGPKHQPVWEDGRILRRVASNMYEVAVPDQKGELYARVEHTRNLKRLPSQHNTGDDSESLRNAKDQAIAPASSKSETVSRNAQEVQDFKNADHAQQVEDDTPARRPLNGFERRRSARLQALQKKKGGM